MAQEDLFGRTQTVEYAMADLAPALMEAVTTVVDNATPAADERTEQLVASVNAVADALGEQREHDEEVAREWVESVVAMREEIANAHRTQQRTQGVFERATDYLRNIATAVRGGFNRGSGEQWVAISRLSAEAQRNIAEAIRMSDCCGKVTQVITAANTQVTTNDFMGGNPAQQQVLAQDIGQAVGQALGGRGAGYGPGGGGGGASAGGAGGAPGGPPGGAAAAVASAQKWGAALNVVAATLTMIGRTLGDLLEVRLEQIWPSVEAENRFRLAMREAVFLTRGFGKYNRELEVSYRDITNEVMASGVFRNEFQTVWRQNLERGLKVSSDLEREAVKKLKVDGKQLRLDQQEQKLRDNQVKQMKATTATALNTAKMLSMDMGTVNEQFMDWHMQLGMSAADVAEIGRNMRTIAMDSGVYGKNMEKVMKDVDELGKALKSAGNLTAEGMNRAMAVMTRAQQLGVSDVAKPILKAMTSYNALMVEADDKTRHLVISAAKLASIKFKDEGLVQRIMTGGFYESADDANKLAEGFKERMMMGLKQQRGTFAEVGIDVDKMDLTKIEAYSQRLKDAAREAEQAGNLGAAKQYRFALETFNSVTKMATGMEIGDAGRMFTSLKEGAKTAESRIQELQQQISGLQPGKILDEKMAQKLEVETTAYMSMFKTISAKAEAAGGTLDEAARRYAQADIGANIGKSFADQVTNMEGAAGNLLEGMSQKAKAAGQDLNKMLSARGFSVADIKKQLASGEKVQIDGAREVLDSVMQELGIKQKTGEDAMSELTESIRTLNATLGEKLGGGLDLLANNPLLAKLVLVGSELVLVGSEIAKWLGIFVGMWGGSKILRGLLGGGGGGATSAAGRAAGTAGNFVDDPAQRPFNVVPACLTFPAKPRPALAASSTKPRPAVTGALGKTLSIGGVVVSGIFGGEEAKAAGKDFAEGAGFGALTGGAGTGSMLSPMLGVEKGSTADKGLGVAGATAYGAAAGAAIGAAFFGAGAAPGAAIGAAVGALSEVVKILGEKFQWIADVSGTITNTIGSLIEGIWNMIKGVWDIIAGIFTLDLGRIGEGIKKILWDGLVVGLSKAVWSFSAGLIKSFTWALQGIINGILSIPKWIKNVFIDLPKWLYNTILEGLSSLASNEWIGPIIEPFKILWETIGELFSTIWAPVEAVFTALSDALDPAIKAVSSFFDSIRSFFGIEKAADGASGALAFLGSALKVVAQVIGFVIKVAITPLVWIIKGIAAVVSTVYGIVKGIVNGIIGAFKWLWDVLVGHSIIPDLVMGIIKWFAKLPILIPMYLLQALAGLGKAMFGGINKLFSWLGGLGDKIGGPLGAVIKILAFPLKVIGQIASRISEVFGGVGTMLNGLFNLDFAMVWDGIKQVLGGIGGFLWDVLKNVFYEIPKLLGGLLQAVFWDLPKALGGILLTGLKAVLWDFPKWLLGVLVDGLKGLGELIMTGLKTVFVDLPKRFGEAVYAGIDWVTERFKEAWNWVTELPTRIWEGIKEAFTKLKDWVLSWIPGAKGAVEGFQEKADETQKRIEEAGGGITGRVKAAEFSKGVGRTVGGAKDLITGGGEGRWEGAKKMVSGAAEATVGAVKGVVGGAVSIAKKLNPFSWFQEGTREITKTGLAVVHEGEGIIPTPIWNSIAAVGSGAFPMNEGQGVLQSISPSGLAKGASQAVSSGLQSVGDALENVPLNVPLLSESDHHKMLAEHYEKRAAELGARREITPQNLGAYDPGSVREASGGVIDQRVADTRAMVPATPENKLRNTQGITRSETRQRGVVTSSKETGSPADYAALAQHHRRAAEAFKHQTFDPKTASYLSIKAAEGRSRLVEGLTGATNVPLLSESDHHKMLAEHYEKRAAELGARQIAPQNLGAYDPGSVGEASSGVIDQRVADEKHQPSLPNAALGTGSIHLPSPTVLDSKSFWSGGSYVQDAPTLNGQTLPGAESKLTPLTATTDLVDATESYREQLVTDAQKLMDAQRQGVAWEASYTPLGALDSRTTLPDAMSVQPMITQMEGVQPPTDVGRLTRELSGMRPGTGLYDQGDNERLAEAFQTFRSLETQRIEDAQIPMRAADESSNALEAAKVLAEPGTGTQYGKAPSEAAEKALQEKMKVEREQTEGYYEYLKRIADKGAFGAKGVEFHTKAEPGTALNYEQAASRAAEGLIMKTEAFEVDMSSLKQAQEMPEPPTPTISVGDGMIYDRAASEAADDIVAKFSSVMPETSDKQDVLASVGKALEYERSASEAAENNIVSKLTNMMPADSTEKDDVVAAVGKALDYERAGSRAAEQTSTDAALIALSQKEIVPERQNIIADLSRSLDYDRAGSDAATRNLSVGTGREIGSETASPNMIDYTDSLRPMVEPLMVSRTGIEERLEQDRYGEQPSNAGMLPSMDEIADYLTTMQFEKLSEMVALLTEIKNRMSPTSSPRVIGAQGGGTRPMNRPGVKNIAQDLTRGRWDLTFNEHSVSGVTTDGRGGSA